MDSSSLIAKTDTGVTLSLEKLVRTPFPSYPVVRYGTMGRFRCRSCLRDQEDIKGNLFEHRNFCEFLNAALSQAGLSTPGTLAFEILKLKGKLEILEEKTEERHALLRKVQSSLQQLEMDFSP